MSSVKSSLTSATDRSPKEKGALLPSDKEKDVEKSKARGQSSQEPRGAVVLFAVVLYAVCSSCMLIVNKVAVTYVAAPGFVLFCQLASSAFAVFVFSAFGLVESDELEWKKVKAFVLVVVAFVGAVFTNMKTLQYSNVETFIVFRSSTPLLISLLDWAVLGRQLPSLQSWLSLVGLLLGAVMYVVYDSAFDVRAYAWVAAWFAVFTFDQVYIKFVCDTVDMTNWGRVYYTNLLSCLPVAVMVFAFGEQDVILARDGAHSWSFHAVAALLVSCLAGIAMSYSAFLLRALVSATSFTVVGIMCKIATVVINCLIWDKHATPMGLVALSICLAAGSAYKQAPYRS
uniref:Drug metabolite transporter superfamily n=1 Tax=Tetraselmis sp. GSL018 TaxID=582737 RepID=A0A061R0U2_9CHLO